MAVASMYLGHDDGSMHLVAVAGIPCVAVFSARVNPGVWFPIGDQHQMLFHSVPCANCGLDVCTHYAKRCIASITTDEVIGAVQEVIRGNEDRAVARSVSWGTEPGPVPMI